MIDGNVEKYEPIKSQRELVEKLNKAAQVISNQARRGPANYVVMSPFIADQWSGQNKAERRKEKIKEIFNL